jgi:hypothetical protein
MPSSYGWEDVAILLIDGYDFLPYLVEDLTLPESKAILDEFRPAGSRWPRRMDSHARDTKNPFSHTTVHETGTGTPDALLATLPQGGPLVISIQGNVAGRKAICGLLATSAYDIAPSVDKLTRAKAEHGVDGRLYEGHILHAQIPETADFNTESTAIDNGHAADAVTISSSSVANPTVITTAAPHELVTGDVVLIAGHTGSTPAVDGVRTVTVVSPTTFTVAVNVSVGGTGGTVQRQNTRNGATLFIQVPDTDLDPFTLGGHTALALDVRGSNDGSTYAGLAVASSFTVRNGVMVEVSGNIPRHIACGGDFTGAGSSPTASPVIVCVRNKE